MPITTLHEGTKFELNNARSSSPYCSLHCISSLYFQDSIFISNDRIARSEICIFFVDYLLQQLLLANLFSSRSRAYPLIRKKNKECIEFIARFDSPKLSVFRRNFCEKAHFSAGTGHYGSPPMTGL